MMERFLVISGVGIDDLPAAITAADPDGNYHAVSVVLDIDGTASAFLELNSPILNTQMLPSNPL